MIKLNLGCGHVQPIGWVNVDGSRRAWVASHLCWLDRLLVACRLWRPTEFSRRTSYANLLRRLPWDDGSVDCIYMGEVLEHFTKEDGAKLLRECHRVLRPAGILRLRVPDNARFWRSYLREFDACRSRERQDWTGAHERWIEMFFRDICVRPTSLGFYGHFHKWMYDEITLIRAMEQAGFADVERRQKSDSAIADVDSVETRDDLIVEGIKPAEQPRTTTSEPSRQLVAS